MPSISDQQAFSEIKAIYEAVGYHLKDCPQTYLLHFSRSTPIHTEVMISVPCLIEPKIPAEQVIQAITQWQPDGETRLWVVALPSNLTYGSKFQSEVRQAGAVLQNYGFLLDGGLGGEGRVGLGSADRSSTDTLKSELTHLAHLDPELLGPSPLDFFRKSTVEKLQQQSTDRVRQRYYQRDPSNPRQRLANAGADLLKCLVDQLRRPNQGPEIYLLIGHGGAGKTWLFEGIFTYLSEVFLKTKEQQSPGCRPIPVLPQSLLAAGSRETTTLFESVAGTEYGKSGGIALLDHQVRMGRNFLMFDGLDEFFADHQDLGAEIESRYLVEGSRARLLIVLRDSLFETSLNVQSFLRRVAERIPHGLFIYEVCLWDEAALRELAWLKREKRRPQPGETDTPRVRQFLHYLETSPQMKQLAQLPFYADRLVELCEHLDTWNQNPHLTSLQHIPIDPRTKYPLPEDECDLLFLAYELILDREFSKHTSEREPLPERAFLLPSEVEAVPSLPKSSGNPKRGKADDPVSRELALIKVDGRYRFTRLIEEAAYLERRTHERLTVERLRQLYADRITFSRSSGESVEPTVPPTRSGVASFWQKFLGNKKNRAEPKIEWDASVGSGSEAARFQLGTQILRQFVLFTAGENEGTVSFTHEMMADYLAARHIVACLKVARQEKQNLSIRSLMGTAVNGETEIFRQLLQREGVLEEARSEPI